MFRLKLHISVNISVNSRRICTKPSWSRVNFLRRLEWGVTTHVLTKKACFGQYLSEFLTELPQTTTNHDMDHYKWWHESSQITINHHKPWHKPPWTMTKTSTKHDMNHYKSPQTMTWTIMMTQKELCIKPHGFLVLNLTANIMILGTYTHFS